MYIYTKDKPTMLSFLVDKSTFFFNYLHIIGIAQMLIMTHKSIWRHIIDEFIYICVIPHIEIALISLILHDYSNCIDEICSQSEDC